MQKLIERLKELAEGIQAAKLGKRGDVHQNTYVVIDEYHEWRTECEDLFSQYFNEENPQYVTFKDLPRDGNGFTLMNYFEQQYPIFKVLIRKIESGEIMNKLKEVNSPSNGITVFVSHAVKDREIVTSFVDLILNGALDIPMKNIFCVSSDGARIKSGEDWRKAIKDSILSAKINILIITPNYKESEVCLNEMGAAWVSDAHVLPIIVDPITYKTIGAIKEPSQIEKLLDEGSLDRLKDAIMGKLDIPRDHVGSDRWTTKKREFIATVKKILSVSPFEPPIDRESFKQLQKTKQELETALEGIMQEKQDLNKIIEDLKKAKDKKEVNEVLKKHNPSTKFEEFQALCGNVKKLLKNQPGIINGIIFKSYTHVDVTIEPGNNKRYLDDALADGLIDEGLDAVWEETNEMRKIRQAIIEVDHFIRQDLKSDFYDVFEEKYGDLTLDIKKKRFWEEALGISVNFR